MLHFFRTIIKSKVGAIVAIAMLCLLALAFVAADVSGNRGVGGASSGTIAKVGGESVTAADLNNGVNEALQRVRQQDPTLSMTGFVARGGLDIILNDLIDLKALFDFGKDNDIVAGDRLIDSELQRQGALQPQAIPRDTVATRLVARMLLAPAEYGAVMPAEMAWRYSQLLGESRTGTVVVLPSLAFAPQQAPGNAQLAAFYKSHTNAFIRPERRVIRYATFGPDAVKNVPAPTDAEIAKRYDADKAQYAALERRAITQVVAPTEAAAKAIDAEVKAGKSLDASASEKGLAAAKLGPLGKQELSAQSAPAVADAVFAAAKGQVVTARSPLGWYVVRVEAVDTRPARSLAEVKTEIATTLATEKRRAAVTDYLTKIEEQFEGGSNLPEVAAKLGLQLQDTPPLTADGAVYQAPGQGVSPALKPILKTAFSMEENQPQVAEAEPGKTFIVYDVTSVSPSAPAPMNEILGDVKLAYALDMGAANAKAEALKVQAALRKGEKVDAIVARIGKKLPQVERVGMSRPQLVQMQQAGRPVPPPIRLLFAMAKGSVKVQEAPGKRGWFVVVLDTIQPGAVDRKDPAIAAAQRGLGKASGTEYSEALRKAITANVGVTRNEAAIKALRDQLSGKAAAE
ncbi:peptidylprolyl isomerase [Novosphingobium barchaimii]|nr:peptidylprolyl isomerase [Novosphingobium barchaimii]